MDNSKTLNLPVMLKGNNYLLWTRTTRTALRSRGLWEHVENGYLKERKIGEGEPEAQTETQETEEEGRRARWEQEDQLVLAVLQSSLEPSILAAYSYAETAKELWDTLQSVYGNLSNISRIFEVKKALNSLQQEGRMFKDVFGDFMALWSEMEMLRPATLSVQELERRREQDQVFGLLMALDDSFKDLIKHLLRYDKLPTFEEVCMAIQKEEGSRGLFKGVSETAHMTRGPSSYEERRALTCDHCKQRGHIKDKCWVLYPHLKPKKWNSNQGSRAQTTNRGTDDLVRKSDLEALIKSISKLSESGKCYIKESCNAGWDSGHKPTLIDSGASYNMIADRSLISNLRNFSGTISVANGEETEICGKGDIYVFGRRTKAYYVPEMVKNLMSVSNLTKKLKCKAIFSDHNVIFQDKDSNALIGEGWMNNGLYTIGRESVVSGVDWGLGATHNTEPWHERFGHPHSRILKLVVPGISGEQVDCEACVLGKHCRKKFSDSTSSYDNVFDLIHSDVWSSPIPSRDQYKYFISFIDEKSKYTWVTLLKNKSQAFEAFNRFYSYVMTQYNTRIRVLRSDNGGEYVNGMFRAFLEEKGIQHQTTCPYTPQQNGVSERKNRHLLEMARTILYNRGMPSSFWGDAVMTSAYLINRLPAKGLNDKSPYEILNNRKPTSDHLRVFGCVCYVFVPEDNRNKLEPKSNKCVLVGYSMSQKGYKCYSPENKRVYVSRDVRFKEEKSYYNNKQWPEDEEWFSVTPISTNVDSVVTTPQEAEEENSTQENGGEITTDEGETIDEEVTHEEETEPETTNIETEQVIAPRRSVRSRRPPDWFWSSPFSNNMAVIENGETSDDRGNSSKYPLEEVYSTSHLPEEHQTFISKLDIHYIPKTFQEAYEMEDWRKAIEEELASMTKNGTWSLETLPDGKKTVGCKWVFTNKLTSSGDLERRKARLVAKGYTQVYGEDYTDTFAPVAKLHTVRTLLSVAVNNSWNLYQMDVKNAFLQGDLEEEVFMEIPEGVTEGFENNSVCRLHKAIYGLKQSPRAWYHRLSGCLEGEGFAKTHADHSLFTSQGEDGIVVVLIYVDDIIVTGSDTEGIQRTKKCLKDNFEIKDLGELRYFLGIEMIRSNTGISICQRKYVLELLSETGKLGSRPASTPIEDSYKEEVNAEPLADIKQYQRLVGKLIYLTITRPDICFAVNQVSKHMKNPNTHHWNMMERILRYLKSSPGKGIWFQNNGNNEVIGFCDADWAGDKVDRKSTTGYCMMVGGNLVTWKSKKQKVVSLSSAEAEYRAMKEAAKEIVWLRGLMNELGVGSDQATRLFCDNQAALHISLNPVFHERTKHIEVDCHFVREKIQEGLVTPLFVKSEDQCADIFTKATSSQVCSHIYCKIGLKDFHRPILRGNVKIGELNEETKLEEETKDLDAN